MSVWNPGHELTEEQKRILRDKKVQVSRPPAALIELLGPLADFDRDADKARTRFGCAAGLMGVLSVIAAIVVMGKGLPTVLWVGVVVLIAATAGTAVIWSRLSGLDLSNNLRSFALPVLALLSEDMDSKQPVNLRLDLSACTAKEKLTEQSEPYASGAYHRIVDSFYLDPWMEGEATLADGSRLSWSITDRIREREKTKRSSSGKTKTKTKLSRKSVMDVRIELPAASYDVADAGGADVSVGSKRSVFKLSDTVKTEGLDPLSPRSFVDLVAGAYNRVAPVRRSS